MIRLPLAPRADWQDVARDMGFTFHHQDGQKYWEEAAYYRFTLDEVEQGIEAPSAELHQMCLALVEEAVGSEALMARLAIPDAMRDLVAASWRAGAPSLYGRFDFAFDGTGPAKLLEYNADTPTSIFETALFQWQWLEDRIAAGDLPADADQYNRLHDALRDRFAALFTPGSLVHFASDAAHVEDRQTVRYLEDVARQAKLDPAFVAVDRIGVDADGRFVDEEAVLIAALFKLYPWEDMLREPYARHLPGSATLFLEPAWKAILSNKGILPLLWQRNVGHPNLLEAHFDDGSTLASGWVRKPLFSREGANIYMHLADGSTQRSDGPYDGPAIIQRAHPLTRFEGGYPLIGSWVIGDHACGIGIREDDSAITRDSARFVPHAIVDEAPTRIYV